MGSFGWMYLGVSGYEWQKLLVIIGNTIIGIVIGFALSDAKKAYDTKIKEK
jgi:hypothetical protein